MGNEAQHSMRLGGSLNVPIVQVLAKKPLSELPPRYAHPGQEPTAGVLDHHAEEVPVINLQRLLSSDVSGLLKLHDARAKWGFFQLVGHGVSEELLEKLKTEIQTFFNLPTEEMERYVQLPGDMEGYGLAFVLSEEQKLDWADMFYMVTLPVSMRKPHLLPKLPLPLRKLMDLLSVALKMDSEDLSDLFDEVMQSIRFNYYPPHPQPEVAIGITPRSDAVGFTVLLQINYVEGLEIRKDSSAQ